MAARAEIEIEAHAKVNLTLEVLGKRDDGFHDIVSIMQTIDLHDTVTLKAADGLTLVCDDPGLDGDDNLAIIAARKLRDVAGVNLGAEIHLEKRIPVASGLGGGSSDAAAVLTGASMRKAIGSVRWVLSAAAPSMPMIRAKTQTIRSIRPRRTDFLWIL